MPTITQPEIPALTRASKRLRELKDLKEDIEARLKVVNKECKELQERTIPRLMENAEMDKYRIVDAGTVYIKQEVYVSMAKVDDEEEGATEPPFYDWAREHAPDLIKPYIHPKRLQSFCKDRLDNGLPLPDNLIKATFVPTAKILRR